MRTSQITTPTISVIMAVKNGGFLVREAITSVLNQTFENFEFIIINDGSTDNTLEVLSEFDDPRIKIVTQENQGLAKSLNRGLQMASGVFIARQDHDDISLPTRFEKQLNFLRLNAGFGLIGTAAEIWSGQGPTGRAHDHPTDPGILAFELIFNNPFVHPSWMFPRGILDKVGSYTTDPLREPPEDYEYVSRVVREFNVANLSERLVIYREIPNSLSSELRDGSNFKQRSFNSKLALISTENIAFWNQISFADNRAKLFGSLAHGCVEGFHPNISFADIKGLLLRAVRKIEARYEMKIPINMVENKLNSLRYYYLKCNGISNFHKFQAFFSAEGILYCALKFKAILMRAMHL